MKEQTEYKRECKHVKMVHWKNCAECREFLVRKGFAEEISLAVKAELEEIRKEMEGGLARYSGKVFVLPEKPMVEHVKVLSILDKHLKKQL